MKKIITSFCFLLLIGACQKQKLFFPEELPQDGTSYSVETEQRIQQVENKLISPQASSDTTRWSLFERMEFYKVPAVSIAVIDNYQIDWARAYGWADKEAQIPATNNTLFQAASISKSINAVGVLNWVESNNIDLNADIDNYLKSWTLTSRENANGQTISLANLLSHTAGISGDGFFGYKVDEPLPTVQQILSGEKPANSEKVESLFEPNQKFQYTSAGIIITQLMLSDNTGMPYDTYMKEQILNPLGMEGSFFTQPPSKDAPLAAAYWASGNPLEGKYHIYPEMASSGLWTNPTDLSRFIIEVQKSLNEDSNSLLSQGMTKKMLRPYLKDGNSGLGFFITEINGRSYFSHGGNNEGFNSYYFGSMEGGQGVVVMINSENFDILPEIIQSVGKVYGW